MNGKAAAVIMLSGLLAACAPTPQPAAPAAPPPAAPAPAAAAPLQGDRYVTILRATCDTLLALQGDDQEDASLFYIGYTARRFGVRAVNVGAIPTMIRLALDHCAMSPQRTVASAFAEAYREARRW